MPQDVHLETINGEADRSLVPSVEMASNERALRSNAAKLARNLSWLPSESPSRVFAERFRKLTKALKPVLRGVAVPRPGTAISDDCRWIYDNVHLIVSELDDAGETFKRRQKLPQVRTPNGAIVPRVAALAEAFLGETGYGFGAATFTSYVGAFQQQSILRTKELWALVPALKLVL